MMRQRGAALEKKLAPTKHASPAYSQLLSKSGRPAERTARQNKHSPLSGGPGQGIKVYSPSVTTIPPGGEGAIDLDSAAKLNASTPLKCCWAAHPVNFLRGFSQLACRAVPSGIIGQEVVPLAQAQRTINICRIVKMYYMYHYSACSTGIALVSHTPTPPPGKTKQMNSNSGGKDETTSPDQPLNPFSETVEAPKRSSALLEQQSQSQDPRSGITSSSGSSQPYVST